MMHCLCQLFYAFSDNIIVCMFVLYSRAVSVWCVRLRACSRIARAQMVWVSYPRQQLKQPRAQSNLHDFLKQHEGPNNKITPCSLKTRRMNVFSTGKQRIVFPC